MYFFALPKAGFKISLYILLILLAILHFESSFFFSLSCITSRVLKDAKTNRHGLEVSDVTFSWCFRLESCLCLQSVDARVH